MIRAEKLTLGHKGQKIAEAVVEVVAYQGQLACYFVRVEETRLQAMNMIDGKPYAEGQTVSLALDPDACVALPAGESV